jgi:hypothetical protein
LDQGLNGSQKGLRQKNKIAISMTEIGERDNDEDEVDGCTMSNNFQRDSAVGSKIAKSSSEYYLGKIRGESQQRQ